MTMQGIDDILRLVMTHPMTMEEIVKFFEDAGYFDENFIEDDIYIAVIGGTGKEYACAEINGMIHYSLKT